MDTKTRNGIAAGSVIVMWLAVGVAVAALVLWGLKVIAPPAGIMAGAGAVLVVIAAGRRARGAG